MRKRRLTVLPVLLLILTLLAPMCAAAEAPALPTEPIPSSTANRYNVELVLDATGRSDRSR